MIHCVLEDPGDAGVVVAAEVAEIFEVAEFAVVAVVVADLDPKIVVSLQDEPCLDPLHWSAVALVDVPLQAEPRLAPSPAVAMAAILGLGGSLHAVGK